jgi:aminopeptidase N
MEHPGAIFYNAPALLLEPSATQNQLLGRASLIAHETAHMWFGDLVTMRWFDDVWLKEVFANFIASKIVNPAFPEVDHQLRFLQSHYRAAYDVDRTAGTHAIRQPLDNLADAGTLYGAIIYQKAPIVMRQLELLMGQAEMRAGLRAYLDAHAFGNATWDDLVTRLDALTPADLHAWSEVWVNQAGRPRLRVDALTRADAPPQIVLLEEDPAGGHRFWPQSLQVEIGGGGQPLELPVSVAHAQTVLPLPASIPAIDYVLPTAGGLGYGDFVLPATTRTWLLEHLAELPSQLSRGAAWLTLWEEMLDARVAPEAMIDLCLRSLGRESDQQNVERLLGDLETLYWRLVPPATRSRMTGEIESAVRAGLGRAATSTAKGAWFRTLARIAGTPSQMAWLEAVWSGEQQVEGLTLAEPEQVLLAQELAVRAVPGWQEILDRQTARISNADRRERFTFARPALDADPEVRLAFFASLRRPERRRHEPWVLDALHYLHHPLRAASSEPLIAPSLAMLEEIQRTGDIFFPKRWLDATLTGHRSASAAGTVQAFLGSHPDLSLRLRRLVLQSSDTLRRISAWNGR